MFKHCFKIAWRNIWKNKSFSAINILGLALGMACSLLIMFWVKDEYSIDAFHANKKQLFRIYKRQYFDGKKQGIVWTQGPLAAELKNVIPEIQMATAYSWTSSQAFVAGDKVNKQDINAAGPDFFKMFSFELLQGTKENALKGTNSLAISRKMAETFFGSPEAAIHKTIRYDNRKDFIVTAVFENIPQNSTLKFDCLRNWDAYVNDGNEWAKGWNINSPLTFFMIRSDADPAGVEAKLKHFLDNYVKPPADKSLRTELAIQPFHEFYLNSNFKNAQVDGGRIEYVRLFSMVAAFILLIACINFMNLATARSAKRAKEIGVRKVAGALRSDLIGQFVSEAMILTVFSIIVSVLLVVVLLPFFNQLTGKQIDLPAKDLSFWGIVTGLTLITGLVAGSYPAFFLSSLRPILVLKGTLKINSASVWLRKGLVVFQFALSIILIVGMIVIYRQVDYVQTKHSGYERENLVYFPLEGKLINDYDILKEKISAVPGFRYVSHMTENPTGINSGDDDIRWTGSSFDAKIRFAPVGVGYDFAKTINLQVVQGRDFSRNFPTDSLGVLINETALKETGYKDPIGQTLVWGKRKVTIIGVVKDFHFQSLHVPTRPLVAYLRDNHREGNVLIRIEANRTKETLAHLKRICNELNPGVPFTYNFIDEAYTRLYKSEQVISSLSNYFAFIAIFISCLGLLGLAAFTAEQRKKEIGIRKVLGATVGSITSLLSKDLLKLVLIALIIATPVAWYAMHMWLQDFAYRINLSWWIFILAGAGAIFIALLTVSFQAIKAAIANLVKSLRTE